MLLIIDMPTSPTYSVAALPWENNYYIVLSISDVVFSGLWVAMK